MIDSFYSCLHLGNGYLQALTVSGVYDRQDSLSLESALTEHSWKIRTNKLLRASRKPNIYQIQHLEKAVQYQLLSAC